MSRLWRPFLYPAPEAGSRVGPPAREFLKTYEHVIQSDFSFGEVGHSQRNELIGRDLDALAHSQLRDRGLWPLHVRDRGFAEIEGQAGGTGLRAVGEGSGGAAAKAAICADGSTLGNSCGVVGEPSPTAGNSCGVVGRPSPTKNFSATERPGVSDLAAPFLPGAVPPGSSGIPPRYPW